MTERINAKKTLGGNYLIQKFGFDIYVRESGELLSVFQEGDQWSYLEKVAVKEVTFEVLPSEKEVEDLARNGWETDYSEQIVHVFVIYRVAKELTYCTGGYFQTNVLGERRIFVKDNWLEISEDFGNGMGDVCKYITPNDTNSEEYFFEGDLPLA